MSVILASKILQKHIPEGKLLAIVLAHHCYGDSLSCWPSVRRLAAECNTTQRNIYRMLAKLKRAGYVTVKRRQHEPALFTLQPDRMPDLRPDIDATSEGLRPDTQDNSDLTPRTLTPDKNDKRNKEEQALTGKGNRKSFVPPALSEVTRYCHERGNDIDPEHFIDHYTANGWKVGRNSMQDWQAAIRTWEKNNRNGNNRRQKLSTQEYLENELRIADERERARRGHKNAN